MESSRQEYWSRLPFPTPGDLPDPGMESAYIDQFADIEESLHPWDKAHLVMEYDLFNVLLDSDC